MRREGIAIDPKELTLFVAAVANCLYECLSADQLALLAAVFNQLGATMETLAAAAELSERECR